MKLSSPKPPKADPKVSTQLKSSDTKTNASKTGRKLYNPADSSHVRTQKP
jgi:hypothetical protein